LVSVKFNSSPDARKALTPFTNWKVNFKNKKPQGNLIMGKDRRPGNSNSYQNVFPEYGLHLAKKKDKNNLMFDNKKLQRHFKSHSKITHVNYWNLDEISIIE
jgi:hypothetical protein